MYFRADDKKLLEKYKAVFTKIEYLKETELNALLVYIYIISKTNI